MTAAEFIDNPNWADFLPEMDRSPRVRALPPHEDCSPVDPETAALHLRRGGTLGRMPGYEERPGQLAMLEAIVRAFNAREHLMIEAGTGVGKSLAYLVPSILWAAANDTPVVISTATRNLQSQLVASDIPRALAVLGERAGKFKTALLKGRANYLCLRAVGDFFAPGFWSMEKADQEAVPDFIRWLKATPDGDLDGYEGLPRELLACPGEECSGRHCPYYSRCFVYRARRRAAEADLVIANHALVLAEAAAGNAAILPAYGRLVLDEAHNLESVATEFLSVELSKPELTRLLNRLVRHGRGKRAHRAGGVLASVERQLAKGILAGTDVGLHVRRLVTEAASLVVRIVDSADEMLELAERQVLADHTADVVRYRGRLDVKDAHLRFDDAVSKMVLLLHDLRDTLDGAVPPDEVNQNADLCVQIEGLAASFVDFANAADFVLRGERDTHAYWAERVRLERRRAYVRLVAAPLSVADELRQILYAAKDSVVLSSATLRVGNDFRYMSRRLGFCEPAGSSVPAAESRYRCLAAESPFDYFRQCLALAPDWLPDPGADAAKYVSELADLLGGVFSATRGRGLVLFTSYEMMRSVARVAAEPFAAAGLSLLVQGEGRSREAMAQALRDAVGTDEKVVLFGAQSFWEGVDVAGEALGCVVIARLPFAQVKDPIVEARGEKVAREGGSVFRDYTLPEAVVKFRQGFGRLIRTKRDTGVVVVSDPRLATKNYGTVFRRSIPATVHTVASADELLERIAEFTDGDSHS